MSVLVDDEDDEHDRSPSKCRAPPLCQGTRASFRTALAAMQAGKNGGREPAATQLAGSHAELE